MRKSYRADLAAAKAKEEEEERGPIYNIARQFFCHFYLVQISGHVRSINRWYRRPIFINNNKNRTQEPRPTRTHKRKRLLLSFLVSWHGMEWQAAEGDLYCPSLNCFWSTTTAELLVSPWGCKFGLDGAGGRSWVWAGLFGHMSSI